jgi:hypothetical protein
MGEVSAADCLDTIAFRSGIHGAIPDRGLTI